MSDNRAASAPRDKLTGFHFRVLALLVLALMADSYDLQAASFAAPALAKVWDVAPASFAPLFGAGLAGVFVGALGFGWFGDRYGRKRAIVLACLTYGGFSLLCTLAENQTQIFWLRFLMGLGCGGALPNVVSLATELAPQRRRGMLTSLIFVGMPIGGAIPGYVASGLVPDFGWQVIFLIGGVAPIVFALLIHYALPESPAFLAASTRPAADAAAGQRKPSRPTFLQLFSRGYAGTTFLLWLMFTATLMTIYLASSWLPTILRAGGLTATETANINFLYAVGGALSGLALSFVVDRIGLSSVVAFFVLGIASILGVAASAMSASALAPTLFFCGFAVTGVQYALNVSAGLIYPAEFRSSGVGAALGIGRAGSIFGALLGGPVVSGALGATLGSILGGFVDARTFEGTKLFLVPVPVLIVGLIAAAVLWRIAPARGKASDPDAPRAAAH